MGACDQQEFPEMYVNNQLPIEGREAADMGLLKEGINLVGCSSAPQKDSGWTALVLMGLLGLRRRE